MYLKSIEVQGFKSFANKIVFDFHNGITGIVGPNGSGKSNVADAVRWVLGEQSAKQLRGSKMEDVIFAGTQARKPVGFAYVSITFSNEDHALPLDYDEVTVTRKVYRSGESEYQLNGHSCRLKDITELFYDTGIGKEGYSIIGQGQIDKILSGKPEERRELFDEAAGIVKFKRRKNAAIKKLEHEKENLVRVNDILSELEKQVGPLEKQSEKAREYLRLRNDLKVREVNSFLLETKEVSDSLKQLNENINIATADLDRANVDYENTRQEYENIENQINQLNNEIEVSSTLLNTTEVEMQRLDGSISVVAEQINTIKANNTHYNNRIASIDESLASKNSELEEYASKKVELNEAIEADADRIKNATDKLTAISDEISGLNSSIEANNTKILDLLNQKNNITADNQKYKTMLEQMNIKLSELNGELINIKSKEAGLDSQISVCEDKLKEADTTINELNEIIAETNESITNKKNNIQELTNKIDREQSSYHREKSRLESLISITEKYDGYGNSIRKIMELKETNPGILGVIADIVKVERKYETAIETALGGSIQNIVTDNETTAKKLIAYLKENKQGRATFLPLSSISGKNTLENDPCMKEPGVVGLASNLIRVSFEYTNLAKYLLGRILVVDNIDNALVIAKKYKYSLRIVTLEGEQLNPGGSMTGGTFKNSNNLLGRRREIEELKVSVADISKALNNDKLMVTELRKEVASLRDSLETNNKRLRELQLNRNTLTVNLENLTAQKSSIAETIALSKNQAENLESEIKIITDNLLNVSGDLESLDSIKENSSNEIARLNDILDRKKLEENKAALELENIRIENQSIAQKLEFIELNVERINSEIASLKQEKEAYLENMNNTNVLIEEKSNEIVKLKESIKSLESQKEAIKSTISELKDKKSVFNESHKSFFDKREKLSELIADLDKELYRLNANKEKLEANLDSITDYMWEEYELTYSYALELKSEEYNSLSELRKDIHSLKAQIKALGEVNVNAIEQFKEVNERYTFLKGQHDDLIKAEESLTAIIDELDKGMRAQFELKFQEIKTEFDKVFKELFGGGKGTIELVEGEDILEAGIIIISQPPGKKLQNMMQLSGGEKALTAIALLFAIQNLKPSPFCLLDEIEAALDDSNVGRFAAYLHKLTKHTQFIVITHRRGTMSSADRLYGITMQEKGVSTLVSVDLITQDLEKEEK